MNRVSAVRSKLKKSTMLSLMTSMSKSGVTIEELKDFIESYKPRNTRFFIEAKTNQRKKEIQEVEDRKLKRGWSQKSGE